MVQHDSGRNDALERRKSLIGIRMTVLYMIVYGGFVALSVFQPTWMGKRALLRLNLAVTYGLGLIVIAIVFALIYNHLCRASSSSAASQSTSTSSPDVGQQEG